MKTELQTNQHLIQEFMGVEKTERFIPYHSCWNHLMLVVDRYYEKLESMSDFEDEWGWRVKLHEQLLDANKENLYKAVVEFIKYYNQNK